MMAVDTGWAWVVLAASSGSHFLNGILAYFVGVVHAGLLRRFQSSVTTTAWIGALYISLMALGAPLASLVISRLGCRVCCVVGGLLCFMGFTASAFVTSIGQLFFTYGLMAGLGLAFTYSPTNITIGFYFHKYLGLASGIAGSFGAMGILSGSLIIQALIDELSISGAFLLIGAVSLHHSLFAMFYRPTPYEGSPPYLGSRTVEVPGTQEEQYASKFSLALHGLEVRTASLCSVNDRNRRPTNKTEQATPLLKSKVSNGKPIFSEKSTAEHRCENSEISPTGDLRSTKGQHESESTETVDHIRRTVLPENHMHRTVTSNQNEHSHENGRSEHSKTATHCGLKETLIGNGHLDGSRHLCQADPAYPLEDPGARDVVVKCDTDSGMVSHGHSQHKISKGLTAKREGHQLLRNVDAFLEILSNKSFLLHCVGFMAANIHISGTQLHLPEYVMRHGTSPTQAAALFVAVGTLCFVSRLCSGIAVTEPRIDALTLSMGMMGVCGLATGLFPVYSGTYGGQMIFSALFGLYTGGLYSMVSVLTVHFVDVRLLSAAYGVKMFFMGIGVVSGPPLAALIVDSGGTYEHSFMFLGSMMALGSLLDLSASFFSTSSVNDLITEDLSSDILHSVNSIVFPGHVEKTELEADAVSSAETCREYDAS